MLSIVNEIDIYSHRSSSFVKNVRDICQPISRNLGVRYFDYARFYRDGSCIMLYTDPDWVSCFFNDREYISPPSIIRPGAHLWQSYIDKSFIQKAENNFDYGNGLTICRKNADYHEVFNFASSVEHNKILSVYLNNINLLINFCNYFVEQASFIIKTLSHQEHRLVCLREDWCVQQSNLQNDMDTGICELQKTFDNIGNFFSKREHECFNYLLRGCSSKKIAQELKVSPRTIETHINNMKIKFNCRTSLQLVTKYLETKYANLHPL